MNVNYDEAGKYDKSCGDIQQKLCIIGCLLHSSVGGRHFLAKFTIKKIHHSTKVVVAN